MPHVNNKGLVSTDRERKDGYYLYQAYLKELPVLHIASNLGRIGQEPVGMERVVHNP